MSDTPDVPKRRFLIEDYELGESIEYRGLRGKLVPLPWQWRDGQLQPFEFRILPPE